jgi:hypothetical protein
MLHTAFTFDDMRRHAAEAWGQTGADTADIWLSGKAIWAGPSKIIRQDGAPRRDHASTGSRICPFPDTKEWGARPPGSGRKKGQPRGFFPVAIYFSYIFNLAFNLLSRCRHFEMPYKKQKLEVISYIGSSLAEFSADGGKPPRSAKLVARSAGLAWHPLFVYFRCTGARGRAGS